MLEGLVAWVLNNYLGEYFENLNSDQLSIALLQGLVELENLPIRRSALKKFDLPLEVKWGVIGKLTLTIPTLHIRSEPWILKISDLLVLLGPTSSANRYDVEHVEKYGLSKLEQALHELEKHHKAQLLRTMGVDVKDQVDQSQWWGASLAAAITSNMQVICHNVHIRYEDTTSIDTPFNFGIRMQSIGIRTTDSQWRTSDNIHHQPSTSASTSASASSPSNSTFKKLDIKGFSLYWNGADPSSSMKSDFASVVEFKRRMAPQASRASTAYILQPFALELRMERNASKFALNTLPLVPRFRLDIRPQSIDIELSRRQMTQIRALSREWARFDRARQYRRWRPPLPIAKDARLWWRFAINCVTDEQRRHQAQVPTHMVVSRTRHLNAYSRCYRRRLENFIATSRTSTVEGGGEGSSVTAPPPKVNSDKEDEVFMRQVEHDTQLFTQNELRLFRETVFRKLVNQLDRERPSTGVGKVEVFEIVSAGFDGGGGEKDASRLATPPVVPPPAIVVVDGGGVDGHPAAGAGWYDWLSGWFSAETKPDKQQAVEELNEAFYLNIRPDAPPHLTPELQQIEAHMEEDLLEALNESWEDSTIFRRDRLLAEMFFKLEGLRIRFVDEDEGEGGVERILSVDMHSVASRIHFSPREHRTEISLSVADMSLQRMTIVTPVQQQPPTVQRAPTTNNVQ